MGHIVLIHQYTDRQKVSGKEKTLWLGGSLALPIQLDIRNLSDCW